MSATKDLERRIVNYYESEAPHRAPEWLLTRTLDVVDTTAQRRTVPRPSWRFGPIPASARLALTVLAIVVIGSVGSVGMALLARPAIGPAASPSPSASPSLGIFSDVGGWIAYGDGTQILAVDPARPDAPDARARLSAEGGFPRAWSPDGRSLLAFANRALDDRALFILRADGTRTPLAPSAHRSGGTFTPDGSRVVYAADNGIHVVDAAGGAPELVLAADPRWVSDGGCPQYEGCVDGRRFLDTMQYEPALSPDGTKIAYFDGLGDWGHSLRVMNSDGTAVRVVLENAMTLGVGHVSGLDWAPDGEHLVFALDSEGVYVIGVDGSGLVEVSGGAFAEPIGIVGGSDPHWSSDGTRISFNRGLPGSGAWDALVIVRPDGTPVLESDLGRSGPWNPR